MKPHDFPTPLRNQLATRAALDPRSAYEEDQRSFAGPDIGEFMEFKGNPDLPVSRATSFARV
jgi:hypothetical protein